MDHISAAEMLQLRELLQMETNSVIFTKATQALIKDDELLTLAKTGVQQSEARIKSIQQFITDRDLVTATEVN